MLFSQKGHFPWEKFQFCSKSFWFSVKQMEQTAIQLLTWKALSAVFHGGKKSNGQRPGEGEAKGHIQAFSCFTSSLAYECPTDLSKIHTIVWPEKSCRNFWALSAFFASAESNLPFSGEFHSSPFSLALITMPRESFNCLGRFLWGGPGCRIYPGYQKLSSPTTNRSIWIALRRCLRFLTGCF